MTDLGLVSGASYVIADPYIFAIFFAVALHEKPRSLRNLSLLSLSHFVQPALSRIRGQDPAFTLPLSPQTMAIMDEQ